jgi:aryl-alcohol dehydrogenase-like predicted oxidoreductase
VRYRQLGSSGLTVSVVGLGANNFGRRLDARGTQRVVDAAIEAGITFIDTAEAYEGSEACLGPALRGKRQQAILSSKFGHAFNERESMARASRSAFLESLRGSLKRLETDYLDVYMLHQPDPRTPIEETLDTLAWLVRRGVIRYYGFSNLPAWEATDAVWLCRDRGYPPPVCLEHRYNLIERGVEKDVVPVCLRYGLGLVPYVPLAQGILAGNYRRGEPPRAGSRLAFRGADHVDERLLDVVDALDAFARERAISLLDAVIGGLAAQPAVSTVIAGAMTAEQVTANAKAGDWLPTAADLAALNAITR